MEMSEQLPQVMVTVGKYPDRPRFKDLYFRTKAGDGNIFESSRQWTHVGLDETVHIRPVCQTLELDLASQDVFEMTPDMVEKVSGFLVSVRIFRADIFPDLFVNVVIEKLKNSNRIHRLVFSRAPLSVWNKDGPAKHSFEWSSPHRIMASIISDEYFQSQPNFGTIPSVMRFDTSSEKVCHCRDSGHADLLNKIDAAVAKIVDDYTSDLTTEQRASWHVNNNPNFVNDILKRVQCSLETRLGDPAKFQS